MNPLLSSVVREVARQLCDLGTEGNFAPVQNVPTLVFPSKRSTATMTLPQPRISEAEGRILFALALNRQSVPFAIEVPTAQKYTFSGKTELSARVDLMAYAPGTAGSGQLRRSIAVEFKAHNAPPESIRKDLEKLVREGHEGLWFHILQNIDSGTVRALLGKLRAGFEWLAEHRVTVTQPLTVVFVVMAKRLLLLRTIDLSTEIPSALRLEYTVRRGHVEVPDPNGWQVEVL